MQSQLPLPQAGIDNNRCVNVGSAHDRNWRPASKPWVTWSEHSFVGVGACVRNNEHLPRGMAKRFSKYSMLTDVERLSFGSKSNFSPTYLMAVSAMSMSMSLGCSGSQPCGCCSSIISSYATTLTKRRPMKRF